MTYGVKYRLDYCNDVNENARLDIELKDYVGAVSSIEATSNPFILKYNTEQDDRSSYFKTTEAIIEIYEDSNFNIDTLLTSDERAIRIKFYINNNLFWAGFVVPDFYEVNIDKKPIITMVASDRIGTLKNQTIQKGVGDVASFRTILETALALTGLELPLVTTVNMFLTGQTKDFATNTGASWDRFIALEKNEKGISAYDVILSILITANAYLFQRNGQWVVINKLDHEINASTKNIEKIDTGGSRLISQSLKEVAIFSEFGGGKIFPANYDFSEGLSFWNLMGGVDASINDKEVLGYTGDTPVYGSVTENKSLILREFLDTDLPTGVTPKYVESVPILLFSLDNYQTSLDVNINVTGNSGTRFNYQIYIKQGLDTYLLTKDGKFVRNNDLDDFNYRDLADLGFTLGTISEKGQVVSGGNSLKANLELTELNTALMYVRLYNLDDGITTFVNSISIKFDEGVEQKGNLYKTKQATGSSREEDIPTSIFGDYIRRGINGYFYYYSPYESSNIFAKPSTVFTPYNLNWVTQFDSTPLPLLLHSVRQMAKMFSAPHNIITAVIRGKLDALDIFDVCGKKYVLVNGVYDFGRNISEIRIEEVKYASITKIDYVYSYFGGEDTEEVKGVARISTTAGATVGGGVQLGETEFEAYRGDRGKIAYDHSQDPTIHFDKQAGSGGVTKTQAANLVYNLGDGSTFASRVTTNTNNIATNSNKIAENTANISENTNAISNINTSLGDYAQVNGDITKAFSASQLTTNKIILNGIELTIEDV